MNEPSPAAVMLRHLRAARGCTQEQLAERSGCSDRTIRGIETGRITQPQRATLDRIARALELDAAVAVDFVAAWARQAAGPRSIESMVSPGARKSTWAEGLARQADRLREVQLAGTAIVPTTRCAATIRWRRSFRAVAEGIDTYRFMIGGNEPGSIRDPISVPWTRNCRLQRTVELPGDLVGFDFAFDRELEVGEVVSFEFEIDRGGAHVGAEPVPGDQEELIAVRALGPSLFLQVQFDPSDRPAGAWQVHQDALGDEVASEAVRVSPFGVAAVLLDRPRPGFHGLRWTW